MKKADKQFLFRIQIMFAGVVCTGFVLIANLFYIQIRNGEVFREQADGQYVVATHNSFERGSIFFEEYDGSRISAAGQKSGYKISVNPSTFSADEEYVAEQISSVLSDFDYSYFIKSVNNTDRKYVEIAKKVPKDKALEIKDLVGSAVQLHAEKWRAYPLKASASHALGFLAYRGDEYAGRYGLERFYENTLKREDVDLYTNFFARIFHNVQDFVDSSTVPEGDIVATIDPQIQLFLEKQLRVILDTWDSESVGGIIIHPKTGQIYAMGAYPNFDVNTFAQSNAQYFKNPLVENVYEFGSIMKPLVVSMALDSNSLSEEDFQYYDQGSVVVEDYTISNFDNRGRGWVGLQEILTQSLNTGMVAITDLISKSIYRNYFDAFGFTERTNIDLPNEAKNLTTNLKSNRDIEFSNISFGQGIAVTPIGMVRALSALANDGKIVRPHIVKEIEYTNGFSKTIEYPDQDQVISPESAGDISRLLVNAFDEYRDGAVKLENYRIAAKTGTAQIPNPSGGYYDDRNLHSFFAYFPAYDPEFLVLLYTVHPKDVRYSSQTLLDPFRDLANYLINYHDIAPDR